MLWRRLPYLLPWRRRAAERDLQEELRSLRDMAAPGELGNLTLAAENARAQWGWTRCEQVLQDLRFAGRTLRRSPAFTAAAVLSLAIGIGATTSLFTLINTLLWKRLPVRDPERLLVLGQQSAGAIAHGFTYQQFTLIREHVTELDLAAYARVRMNASIDGNAEPTLEGQLVTGRYFPLLGLQPALGRLLGPDDDRQPLAHPVVVLAHGYWRTRFNADPAVIGREIRLSGERFSIVGVAPAGFLGVEVGAAPELFVPVMMQPAVMPMMVNLLDRPNVYSTWLHVLCRLARAESLAAAAARLDALAGVPETDWRPRNKSTGRPEDVRLVVQSAATGLSDLRRRVSQPLVLLLSVSAIVLAIACANVAGLLLARSAARRAEFGLRLALGAGRGRLIRQVLVEGLVLAALAGAAGVALAFWATRALVIYAASGQDAVTLDLSPDLRVLAFALGVSTIAGLVFASVPALRAARADLPPTVRLAVAHGIRAGGSRGPGAALVAAQVALSLVLLVAAGVFVRSLRNLQSARPAVDGARVLIVPVEPRGSADRNRHGSAQRFHAAYRDLLDRVAAIPGVQLASLARTTPLSPATLGYRLAPADGGPVRMVASTIVYPRFFATMGIPVVRGREFTDDDVRPAAPAAIIVNEAFVRAFLARGEPLGSAHGLRTAKVVGFDSSARLQTFGPGDLIDIVGVVADTPFPALREPAAPTVYQTFLHANTGFAQMVLHARVAERSARVLRDLRAAVQAVDPVVPLARIHSLDDEVDAALVRERLVATLSTLFAAAAVLLACLGLYGLLAFAVSQRTAEIGIRVALGAAPADVRRMLARQATTIVLPGIAIGLAAAWMAARLTSQQLAGLLYQLPPTDPLTMGAAALVLALVAMGASLVPAHRASRIDPVSALRME